MFYFYYFRISIQDYLQVYTCMYGGIKFPKSSSRYVLPQCRFLTFSSKSLLGDILGIFIENNSPEGLILTQEVCRASVIISSINISKYLLVDDFELNDENRPDIAKHDPPIPLEKFTKNYYEVQPRKLIIVSRKETSSTGSEINIYQMVVGGWEIIYQEIFRNIYKINNYRCSAYSLILNKSTCGNNSPCEHFLTIH